MPIVFACPCGKKLRAKDESIGVEFICPKCGLAIIVPEPNVFREPEPPLDLRSDGCLPRKAKSGRRPLSGYLKDPVVLIGVIFPALVLVAFGAYLIREDTRKVYREAVFSMKADADKLFASDPELAHSKYEQLLQYLGSDPGDEDCRRAMASARKSRDHLYAQVRSKIEARKAAEEKARKIREEDDKYREKMARLASYRADLSGGAWIERKTGVSEPVRGLDVRVIPLLVPKKRILGILDSIRPVRWLFAQAEKEYGRIADDQLVDVGALCEILHLFIEGAQGNSLQKFEAFSKERAWPELVDSIKVASASTNIDGKFTIKGLQGGKYRVCARTANDFFFMEWVVQLDVEKSGDISLDLFNSNAAFILNKFESPE